MMDKLLKRFYNIYKDDNFITADYFQNGRTKNHKEQDDVILGIPFCKGMNFIAITKNHKVKIYDMSASFDCLLKMSNHFGHYRAYSYLHHIVKAHRINMTTWKNFLCINLYVDITPKDIDKGMFAVSPKIARLIECIEDLNAFYEAAKCEKSLNGSTTC